MSGYSLPINVRTSSSRAGFDKQPPPCFVSTLGFVAPTPLVQVWWLACTVVLQLCVPCFRLFHDVRSQPALPLEATRRGPGNSGSGPIQRREASRPDFFNLSNDASISRRRRCTSSFYHRRYPAHTSYGPVSTPALPICSENTTVPSA